MLSESIRRLAEGEITSIGNILTAETTPDGEVTTFCLYGNVVLTAYHKALGGLYEAISLAELVEDKYLYHNPMTTGVMVIRLIYYFDIKKDYLASKYDEVWQAARNNLVPLE